MTDTSLIKPFTKKLKSIKTSEVIDFFAVVILSSIAIIISLSLSSQCPDLLYENYDVWYGADVNRAYDNLVNLQIVGHYRNHVHPIFPILMIPLVRFLNILGFSDLNAAYLLIALSGAVVVSLLYLTLRFNGLSILSSLLGSSVFLSSGAFIFWWSVVETFPIGGATISIIFLLVAMGNKSKWIWAIGTALTLSITITNWIAGIIGSLLTFNRKKAIKILSIGFTAVLLLFFVQSFIVSKQNPFKIAARLATESSFIVKPDSLSELPSYFRVYFKRTIDFFVDPAVVSQAKLVNNYLVVRQYSFKYSIFGWVSIICWITLLVGGLVKIFQSRRMGKLASTLLLFILFQFLLHMFYGDSPFLYSGHYCVALILVASYSLHGKYSKVFQLIAFVFCVNAIYNNFGNFNYAMELLHS